MGKLMNVEIETNGTLLIEGETPLEKYALSKWFEDWDRKKSTLRVKVTSGKVEDWESIIPTSS